MSHVQTFASSGYLFFDKNKKKQVSSNLLFELLTNLKIIIMGFRAWADGALTWALHTDTIIHWIKIKQALLLSCNMYGLFLRILYCRSFHYLQYLMYLCRDHSGYGFSQGETTLQCNVVPHWLSPYPEWSLFMMSDIQTLQGFEGHTICNVIGHVDLVVMTGTTLLVPCHVVKPLQLIWIPGTCRFHLQMSNLQMM